MLKDKNQVNFAKSSYDTYLGLRCVLSLVNNFDVGKHTLHYVLPVLCEKPVTIKSKTLFEDIIERIMVIDSEYLFQELMGRLKQKNAVTILHNLEIIFKLVNEQKIRSPEVDHEANIGYQRTLEEVGRSDRPFR